MLLTYDVEHVITHPSKEHQSVWTDSDLKFIVTQDLHQKPILSRVLEQLTELKQEHTDGTTRVKASVASVLLETSQRKRKVYQYVN